MRRSLFALMLLLLIQGSAFAQAFDETSGAWASADYLSWWMKSSNIPPLVTVGGNGALGMPGTQVLLDNLDFDNQVRPGGRFSLGYRFESGIGIEANYIFLAERSSNVTAASDGNPVLSQPFFDINTGMQDSNIVAFPGVAVGSVTVNTQSWLNGAEANLTSQLPSSDRLRLVALGGFRYLRLEDRLTNTEHFAVAPSVPGFGGNRVFLQDDFHACNDFYGGQVGLDAAFRRQRLTLNLRGKLALGQMQQRADVNGFTRIHAPSGAVTVVRGGMYALSSNSGSHEREALAFVPEVGLNFGFQLTRRLKLQAGYTLLWVSTVTRAGEQIDPTINVTQFPVKSPGPLVGPARPAFPFDGNDFWAQGLNLGLEFKF